MPELPEVETVRKGLSRTMEGARIARVEVNRPDLRFPFPKNFSSHLENRTINSVTRRAKYLEIHLNDNNTLVAHLGMSGSFYIEEKDFRDYSCDAWEHIQNRLTIHDHVVFHLVNNRKRARVIYNDPRRFGFMDLIADTQLDSCKYFSNLGIEPTGDFLNTGNLRRLFKNRKVSLKVILLNQRVISGLGNIYACEALWQAALSPKRQAATLCSPDKVAVDRAQALSDAIRDVISRAIKAGGSSISNHRQTDGVPGYFQHNFNVYNRKGKPCLRKGCHGSIRRIQQSGRSTCYCAICQK